MLRRLQSAPAMFGLDGTYDMYVAFLHGYDFAGNGDWLYPFRAWLVTRLGYGENLGWQSLVPRIVFPDESKAWHPFGPRDRDADAQLVQALFELLEEFANTGHVETTDVGLTRGESGAHRHSEG